MIRVRRDANAEAEVVLLRLIRGAEWGSVLMLSKV